LSGFWPDFLTVPSGEWFDFCEPSFQQSILRQTKLSVDCSPQYFTRLLLSTKIGERGFVYTDRMEEANILFESVFTDNPAISRKQWTFSILFSGESFVKTPPAIAVHYEKYHAILCSFGIRHPLCIDLPLFMYHLTDNTLRGNLLWNRLLSRTPNRPIPPKFCCFVVSNGAFEPRNRIFRELSKYKRVDSLGKFENNMGHFLDMSHTSPEYFEVLSQYKFILCFENAVEGTYITEKIVNAYIAHILPVYYGTPICKDIFVPGSFLYLEGTRDEDYARLVQQLVELDQNEEEYRKRVSLPVFQDVNELERVYGMQTIAHALDARIPSVLLSAPPA
jgi:hypothetical protein